jgi:hypothetical protein
MIIPSATIQQEIAPGERVLWSGTAVTGLRLEPNSLLKSGMGFCFCSISIVSVYQAIETPDRTPILPLFIGTLFMLIGFYQCVGHFFLSALDRKHTEFAVTDRRVVVRVRKITQSIEYPKIPILTLTEQSDGSGTIQFGETKAVPDGDGISYIATKIEAVPDVRRVYNIIRKGSDAAASRVD